MITDSSIYNLTNSLAEFNEKFSTSISPTTVRRVLREAGLHGCSTSKNILLERKIESLGFHLQNQ